MNDEQQPQFESAKSEVQRKTLDQREQMNELMRLRHSCAHILATAVLRLWPDALLDIGPPTEEGFYYDFDLKHRFTPDDFPKIEEEMRRIAKENQKFERFECTREEAEKLLRERGQVAFKLGRLADVPAGETISFYKNGEFVDLCAQVRADHSIKALVLTGAGNVFCAGAELGQVVHPDGVDGEVQFRFIRGLHKVVQRIRELNKLDSAALDAGQTLIAPLG